MFSLSFKKNGHPGRSRSQKNSKAQKSIEEEVFHAKINNYHGLGVAPAATGRRGHQHPSIVKKKSTSTTGDP